MFPFIKKSLYFLIPTSFLYPIFFQYLVFILVMHQSLLHKKYEFIYEQITSKTTISIRILFISKLICNLVATNFALHTMSNFVNSTFVSRPIFSVSNEYLSFCQVEDIFSDSNGKSPSFSDAFFQRNYVEN